MMITFRLRNWRRTEIGSTRLATTLRDPPKQWLLHDRDMRSCNRRTTGLNPCASATGDGIRVHTGPAQDAGGGFTSVPASTNHVNRACAVDFVGVRGHVPEWNKACPRHMPGLVLVWLAHVDDIGTRYAGSSESLQTDFAHDQLRSLACLYPMGYQIVTYSNTPGGI